MADLNKFILPAVAQVGLSQYNQDVQTNWQTQYNIRNYLEHIDVNYMRELDYTQEHNRAKLANNRGDTDKIQNVTIPVIMPQVEAFVTYQSSVFLTGEPIFGVVASDEYMDAAMQVEAILSKQSRQYGWRAQLIKAFRNMAKYNLAAVECSWCEKILPSFSAPNGDSIVWAGNKVTNLNLYNTFWDTSVPAQQVSMRGEYAGYNKLLTMIAAKQLIRDLGNDVIKANLKLAFESSFPRMRYVMPELNPQSMATLSAMGAKANGSGEDFDWLKYANITQGKSNISYRNHYLQTTLYCRILPSVFNIQAAKSNTPQIWKLIFLNDVLIHASLQDNIHDMLPILFCAPYDDDLDYQTKSLAENALPYQQVGSALLNGALAARRRAVSDRAIYNSAYLSKRDVENPNPSAKIPLRAAAYNKLTLSDIYMPIPFKDDQSGTALSEANMITQLADVATGQNKAQQGQFVKGNKTLHEYDDIMGNANARNQVISIAIEDQFFAPMKHIVLTNILQYQTTDEIYHKDRKKLVQVNPVTISNAVLEFQVSDGLTPVDKLIRADAWKVAFQTLGSSPQLAGEYKVGKLFSYLLKTQGADVTEFEKSEEEKLFEQQMMAWQQAVIAIAKNNPEATNFPPQPVMQQPQPTKPQPQPSIIEQMAAQEQQQ